MLASSRLAPWHITCGSFRVVAILELHKAMVICALHVAKRRDARNAIAMRSVYFA